MKINLNKCETSAQAVTKVCYNEATRNLNYRIQCKDLDDLKECVSIINGYNEFEWKRVNRALDEFFDIKKYFNKDNPNNGNNLFDFDIARESSVAMYIKFYGGASSCYSKEGKMEDFLEANFKLACKSFQHDARADECDIYEDGGYLVCRLWWD